MNADIRPDADRTARDGRASISDVARKAGVSKATVSRFLNHRETLLTPGIATRVEAAIAELGYAPRPMAQALKRGRSRLIGLVVADVTNPFSVAVLRGAEKACQDAGYLVMLFNLGNAGDREREAIETLASYQVEGFILNTPGTDPAAARELARHGKPAVLVDRQHEAMQSDFLSLDNVQSVNLALAHLLANGYSELIYLTSPVAGVSSRLERKAAFEWKCASSGVACQVREFTDGGEADLASALRTTVQRAGAGKAAVLAGNALITLRAAAAISQLGWQPGRELALVGFDDTEWAPLVGPGLTTIAQPTDDLGRLAAGCLLERLQGLDAPPRKILLPGKLMVRPSSQRADATPGPITF